MQRLGSSSNASLRAVAARIAKKDCLTCGNIKYNGGFDCRVSGFPLTCSGVCWQDLHANKLPELQQLGEINQHMHWLRTPAASELVKSHETQIERKIHDRWAETWEEFMTTTEPHDIHALRLISAMNTHVLTLDRYLLNEIPMDTDVYDIAVLGARTEALMPGFIWNRLAQRNCTTRFQIALIGDDVPQRHGSRSSPSDAITLSYSSGLYHEMNLPDPNAFVLFHPGLGHKHLRSRWRPTIERVLESQKPILMTAFSELDQERDMKELFEIAKSVNHSLDIVVQPQLNAFRSLNLDLDPLNVLSPIQVNKYVTVLKGFIT